MSQNCFGGWGYALAPIPLLYFVEIQRLHVHRTASFDLSSNKLMSNRSSGVWTWTSDCYTAAVCQLTRCPLSDSLDKSPLKECTIASVVWAYADGDFRVQLASIGINTIIAKYYKHANSVFLIYRFTPRNL